jgi:predicted house-cleaning noncanonical NTP pyrophosphatase (MazG superfamily)
MLLIINSHCYMQLFELAVLLVCIFGIVAIAVGLMGMAFHFLQKREKALKKEQVEFQQSMSRIRDDLRKTQETTQEQLLARLKDLRGKEDEIEALRKRTTKWSADEHEKICQLKKKAEEEFSEFLTTKKAELLKDLADEVAKGVTSVAEQSLRSTESLLHARSVLTKVSHAQEQLDSCCRDIQIQLQLKHLIAEIAELETLVAETNIHEDKKLTSSAPTLVKFVGKSTKKSGLKSAVRHGSKKSVEKPTPKTGAQLKFQFLGDASSPRVMGSNQIEPKVEVRASKVVRILAQQEPFVINTAIPNANFDFKSFSWPTAEHKEEIVENVDTLYKEVDELRPPVLSDRESVNSTEFDPEKSVKVEGAKDEDSETSGDDPEQERESSSVVSIPWSYDPDTAKFNYRRKALE